MFVAALAVDLDEDGIGEFGTLGELTGVDPLRGYPSQAYLEPPVVSPGLRPTGAHGTAQRSGYCFRLYLPGPDGSWLRVDEDPSQRTADESEVRWCVFAWPVHHEGETTRTFRVDQTGRVSATNERQDASRLGRLDTSDWIEVR